MKQKQKPELNDEIIHTEYTIELIRKVIEALLDSCSQMKDGSICITCTAEVKTGEGRYKQKRN